jgi:S-adenosylmethionine:tRNA ribosyltransferase-isomerase
MVLHRDTGRMEHRYFFELPEVLKPPDVLVLNDTRVIPARLSGRKDGTGGAVEVLLLKQRGPDLWEAMVRGKVVAGSRIVFDPSCAGDVVEDLGPRKVIRMEYEGEWDRVLSAIGRVPLPPYIRREPCDNDRERYQTVYGVHEGAVAAPTAGLHFTEETFRALRARGVGISFVTLHVGEGTFRPVREGGAVEDHPVEAECYEIGLGTVEAVHKAKEAGGRVVAVGTTTTRVLETATHDGRLTPAQGETRLFIYPGYRFRAADALLTNFHLPKTTLLMLVMAFAGRDFILRAYREAMNLNYRFYSYGDAMLIL